MGIPVYEGTATESLGALDTNFTLSMPATRPDDDVYIAVITLDGSVAPVDSSGNWTELYSEQVNGTSAWMWIGRKVGSSEPATYAFTCSNNEVWSGSVHRLSGQKAGDYLGVATVTPSAGTDSSAELPIETAESAESIIFWVVGVDSDEVSSFSAGTERYKTADRATAEANHGVATADSPGASTSTAANTATLSASDQWIGVTFEILGVESGGGDNVPEKINHYRQMAA